MVTRKNAKKKDLEKIMKKLCCILLVLCLAVLPLVGCTAEEELEIVSCGSGFYFNRSAEKTYVIEELGVESTGNYFYLPDYFVSETLGTEYEIKDGWFKTGSVFLAKKSEHYDSIRHTFNVDEYNNRILAITPEMNYVGLYSESGEVSSVQIQITSGRTTPLDLKLENVSLTCGEGLPVIFSAAVTDVNFILAGENEIVSAEQLYTVQELAERAKNQLFGDQEEAFYEMLDDAKEEFANGSDAFGDDPIDGLAHYLSGIGEIGKGVVDGIVDGVTDIISGAEGIAGAAGADAIILPGGVSFSGTGRLSVTGGKGAAGSAATNSLMGDAKGGNGGAGGDAILCNAYLDVSGGVTATGGDGGAGGEGSKGLFSSGEKGDYGKSGVGLNVANKRSSEN